VLEHTLRPYGKTGLGGGSSAGVGSLRRTQTQKLRRRENIREVMMEEGNKLLLIILSSIRHQTASLGITFTTDKNRY
jgi:hypothetical protein